MPEKKTNGTKLISLSIEKLQGIANLREITFVPEAITGVFGPNCLGKTTILHAIACLYQPQTNNENYIFSRFFRPTPDDTWSGSSLSMTTEYQKEISSSPKTFCTEKETVIYKKNSDRWSPKYSRRFARDMIYIGIDTCVPSIDKEKGTNRVIYRKQLLEDENILRSMSDIFNRKYDELYDILVNNKQKYKGLKNGNLSYSSLSMGAGEQRMLCILKALYSLKKNGLLLVDELDLLLHDDALFRFIEIAKNYSEEKNLQIIFTSHRLSLLDMDGKINIRHILRIKGNSYSLNGNSIEAIRRLSGIAKKPIEVFVEDTVSACIVEHVAFSLGIRKYLSVKKFGAASNAFTVAASLVIKDEAHHKLIVLDGDEYAQAEQKDTAIKKVLSGSSDEANIQRLNAKSLIQQYSLPNRKSPEQYIVDLIRSVEEGSLDERMKEVRSEILQEVAPRDFHNLFQRPIEKLGFDFLEGIRYIIEIAAKSPEWNNMIVSVQNWLQNEKNFFDEHNKLELQERNSSLC